MILFEPIIVFMQKRNILFVGTGNGYYIYIETSLPAQSRQRARLESEVYFDNYPRYFSFWYHM